MTCEECIKNDVCISYLEEYDDNTANYCIFYEAQRPHGEWIKHENDDFHCTNCGFEIDTYIASVFFNFCPNCGADMREGEQE